jgi:hypothetical protein
VQGLGSDIIKLSDKLKSVIKIFELLSTSSSGVALFWLLAYSDTGE